MKKCFCTIVALSLWVCLLSSCGGASASGVSSAETGSPEKVAGTTTKKEITESDIVGRWICATTKDIFEFKEGGIMELTEYGWAAPNGSVTGVQVQGNSIYVHLYPKYDQDGILEYDDSGEIKKLIADSTELILESDYYAGLERFSLGDTISTDSAEVVINDFSFVSGETLIEFCSNHLRGSLERELDPDMAYTQIKMDITNMSKQEVETAKAVHVSLDYNNGFIFSTGGDSRCVLIEDGSKIQGCSFYNNGNGGTNISNVTLSPLDTKSYLVFIPCAKRVAEDQDATYAIYLALPTENGIQEFAVDIK